MELALEALPAPIYTGSSNYSTPLLATDDPSYLIMSEVTNQEALVALQVFASSLWALQCSP
jgi:hypothetical protein